MRNRPKDFLQFVTGNQLILVFLLLYLFFSTHNPSLDAWGYACSIKYGTELYTPHHLLYNAFQFILFKSVQNVLPLADAFTVSKMVNAFFAAGVLYFIKRILEEQGLNRKTSAGWVLLAGSCFGLMRFATENETYIIPIFFSCWGSWHLLKENYWQAGLFLAVACLFHQIHFFWWLSGFVILCMYSGKAALRFIVPAMLVPLVYALVVIFYNKQTLSISTFFQFVFTDYLDGSAETGINIKKALILSPISFIRSFVQLHGNIWFIVKDFPIIFGVFLFLLGSVFVLIKQIQFKPFHFTVFQKILLLAFGLHMLFAFYSAGNAEFMVMLPILLITSFAPHIFIPVKTLFYTAFSVLLWNMCTAILPNRFYTLHPTEKLTDHMHKHPDACYILKDYWNVYNPYVYKYGSMHKCSVSIQEGLTCDTCFKNRLSRKLEEGISVYTDCMAEEKILDRGYFMHDEYPDFLKSFRSVPEDTLFTRWHKNILYRITAVPQK